MKNYLYITAGIFLHVVAHARNCKAGAAGFDTVRPAMRRKK